MTEEKKVSEDKGYAQLTREHVCLCGESIGILSDELLQCFGSENSASIIAEDASYRIREVAHKSKQFMKHSKRKSLRSKDFNNALAWSNVDKVYGYNETTKSAFTHVKDANVFVIPDEEVDLQSLSSIEFPSEQSTLPRIKAEWFNVGGITESQGTSTKLNLYYDEITKAILGSDDKLLKCALDDLRTNPKINNILPYLINFIGVGVKKLSHDLDQLLKILHTLQALCSNKHLFLGLKPYLDTMISALLHCILEPLTASINSNIDHWFVRDYAARILAEMINEWSSAVNQLKVLIENVLQEWLVDSNVSFYSYYGAISTFINFGPGSIEYGVIPHLKIIWNNLGCLSHLAPYPRQQLKDDAMKVQGMLLQAAEMIMINKSFEQMLPKENGASVFPCHPSLSSVVIKADRDPEFSFPLPAKNTSSTGLSTVQKTKMRKLLVCKPRKVVTIDCLYSELYEYFGDRLAMRLPCISAYVYKPKAEKLVNLFSMPDLIPSGEEMLNSFYDKEEVRSNNSLDEDHSYDDNSVISDDQELCIKDSVSDPSLGIKLIITKIPKSKHSSSPDSPKNSKRKKFSLRIPRDTPENSDDDSNFIKPLILVKNRPVNILFEGSYPVPVSELKQRRLGIEFKSDEIRTFDVSKFKLFGPPKTKLKKEVVYRSRFRSGSLLSIF